MSIAKLCTDMYSSISDKEYLKFLEKLLYYFFSSHVTVYSDLSF